MPKSKSGFTIVELLIVIVVIAVLAAITIVAFQGIQKCASGKLPLLEWGRDINAGRSRSTVGVALARAGSDAAFF